MARVGVLYVSGNESRHFATRRALRVDQQPEFRRTARPRRPYAPGQSDDGNSGGDCRTLHRHKELEVRIEPTAEKGLVETSLAPSQPAETMRCRISGFVFH